MKYEFEFDEITSCHICPFFRETPVRRECGLTGNSCSNTNYNKSREADCPLIAKDVETKICDGCHMKIDIDDINTVSFCPGCYNKHFDKL